MSKIKRFPAQKLIIHVLNLVEKTLRCLGRVHIGSVPLQGYGEGVLAHQVQAQRERQSCETVH